MQIKSTHIPSLVGFYGPEGDGKTIHSYIYYHKFENYSFPEENTRKYLHGFEEAKFYLIDPETIALKNML